MFWIYSHADLVFPRPSLLQKSTVRVHSKPGSLATEPPLLQACVGLKMEIINILLVKRNLNSSFEKCCSPKGV